jgi:hypothetical protein
MTLLPRSARLFLFGLACAVQTFAASNQPAPAPAKPGTLQVQVIVPPTWQPMFEDRITEAFVSNLIDVFRRQGYKGEIVEVRWFEEPSAGCCLLTINLTEWRMNHIGNIDCMFTANLQTGRATRHLGIFSGMAFRWMSGPGRFGLSDAFEDAAEDAVRQLYFSLAKTELVPGLRTR